MELTMESWRNLFPPQSVADINITRRQKTILMQRIWNGIHNKGMIWIPASRNRALNTSNIKHIWPRFLENLADRSTYWQYQIGYADIVSSPKWWGTNNKNKRDNWEQTLENLNLGCHPRKEFGNLSLEHLTQKHTGYKCINNNFYYQSSTQ